MRLTTEQQEILDGKKGETYAKIMETLVRYGELFGAEEMAEVTGQYGHLVTSFGLQVIDPVYKLMDELISAGVVSKQKFTMDPRPLDKNVPSGPIKDLVFYKFMYSEQKRYEKQLSKLGLKSSDAFSCACYFEEQGNRPKKGDILSWAESSAVVYANSVLGARCNRNSGIIELFGSILGCVPKFGLLTDEGRKATWRIEVKTSKLPSAQVLGSAIGMKVMEDVPYVFGLDEFLGDKLTPEVCTYLKNFGAATASNGAVGLYHIDKLTPEATELGTKLITDDARTYIIDDAEIKRVIDSYPIIWKNPDAKPKMCFIGCPHLSKTELLGWIHDIYEGVKENGLRTTTVPTVLTSAPGVIESIKGCKEESMAEEIGLTISYICPLMYCDNPLVHSMPIITNSNKLRTYTSCRFYEDDQILDIITGKGRK
ncbi:MAG: DUF521 domain-containing protein [Butyrivibrio sp.]|nr:aconitase X [Butyrivibrio sp.]MBQ6588183.1 DUF521 domain-containing protein [Butyrivibrio sp.]